MGFQVNLPQSSIAFSNPEQGPELNVIGNSIRCVMHSFTTIFNFSFGPHGVPALPLPVSLGCWEVGIVQNVLFERMYFEYADGSVFSVDFDQPILDSSAVDHSPFYSDPFYLRPEQFTNPVTMETTRLSLEGAIPVRDLFYTSAGFGELFDPWDPSGVAIINDSLSVQAIDRPGFRVKLRHNGNILVRTERIVSFQSWLVAKSGSQRYILAHVSPFSLISWASTEPESGHLSIHRPEYQFGYYGRSNIVRTVSHSGSRRLTHPGMSLGQGHRTPVLSGQTANERGRRWLESNRLLP